MVFSYRTCARAAALAALMALPGPAAAETIREALTSAYRNNPTILSALLNVHETAENIVLAKSAKRPAIGASLSAVESYTFDGASSLGTPSLQAGLSYSQSLFDNFKSDADVEAARAFTEASRYGLQNAEQNVFLAVVQAYMGVVRDSQLVRLRQENVRFFDAQVQSARDRLEVGEGTRIDLSQAEARLAQGNAALQAARAALVTSNAAYERFVGHRPGKLSATYRLGSLLPKSLEAAIGEAVSAHPAILSARAGIRAAQAKSEAANAAFGPTLDLVGQVGSTLVSPNPGSSAQPTASLRLNLTVPIYGGGRFGAGIRKASIAQARSEVDALAARDQVKESVISAWSSVQNAQAQITSVTTALESGELSLDGVVQSREVGQATTLDVLNAQSELTQIREALIQASTTRVVASFALVAATGHLTAADLSLDVVIRNGEDYIAKVEDVWQEFRAFD